MMNVELDLDVYDYCLGHCFKRDSGFFFFFVIVDVILLSPVVWNGACKRVSWMQR